MMVCMKDVSEFGETILSLFKVSAAVRVVVVLVLLFVCICLNVGVIRFCIRGVYIVLLLRILLSL